jgi:hypothetical protein
LRLSVRHHIPGPQHGAEEAAVLHEIAAALDNLVEDRLRVDVDGVVRRVVQRQALERDRCQGVLLQNGQEF